ncbi:MAG: zinc ribbon domain-containing protein [Phycisphaeraceae bacterium]|nr:MAG: zinc ribbon domain-containing protein [Phycisphaeraceae bacterium]
MPRVRDAHGHYACKACLDAKQAGGSGEHARDRLRTSDLIDEDAAPIALLAEERLPAPPAADDGLAALVAGLSESAAHTDPTGGLQVKEGCPKCGRPYKPGQVICLECGTNVQSGKKLKTRVRDRDAGEPPPPPSAPRLALAALGSAAGAAVGLAIWVAASAANGLSSYVLVFLVGVLAAAPALLFVRGAGTITTGVIAATMAFFAIAGGMRMTPPDTTEAFEWTVSWHDFFGDHTETKRIEGLDESQKLIFEGAWIAAGVLVAFSVGVTNPYDPEEDEEDE